MVEMKELETTVRELIVLTLQALCASLLWKSYNRKENTRFENFKESILGRR